MTACITTQQKKRAQKKFKFAIFSSILFVAILVLGSLAFFSSMREIRYSNAGRELYQVVEREMLRLEAVVNGEVSLVLKMADSPLIQQYFLNPDNAELEKIAFAEFAGYRRILMPKSLFWANSIDRKFFLNDAYAYIVDPDDPENYWYNMTLNGTELFNFNINYNPDLNVTNFWINAPVFDSNHKPIGILGTGIDVSNFIDTIFRNYTNNAPLFFFNKAGEITGAINMDLVKTKTSLESELGNVGSIIFSMLENLEGDEIQYFKISGGVAALGAIPEFDWYVCAALPIHMKEILYNSMTIVFAAMMVALAGVIIILNLLLSNFEMMKEIGHLSRWYKTILDATPLPIMVTDSNMNWTFANKVFENLIGINIEDMLGKPCSNWYTEICNTPNCSIACAERGIKRTSFTYDGATFQVDVEKLNELNDEVTGYIVVIQDITKLESLVRLQAEATAASIAKSSFLSSMSHEMRTPLNAVIGLSELAIETELSVDEMRSNLEKIYNAGTTLLSTVNDILDISKVEAGKLELVEAEYNVPSLINDTITQSIMHIGEKPVEFRLDINEDLPQCLFGDELRVKQIMNNLLSNACKYTREGFVELHIHCESEGDGIVWLVISVRDTGIGIKQEDINELFSEYSQMDAISNREIEGTGLGLSLAQKIAALMEGEISVKSEYGKGSIFTVRLKQKYISGDTIGSETESSLKNFRFSTARLNEHSRFSCISLPYAQVLVVDDNVANLDVVKGILTRYGMKIDCVQSGQRAIEAIREEKVKYNMVFMDHMMPGMDGIEATRIIREEIGTEYAKTIPIIALTANAIIGNDEMFLSKGFQAFISKPIEIDRLDAVIRRWVRDEEQEKQFAAIPQDFRRGNERQSGLADRQKIKDRRIVDEEIAGLDINKGIKRFGDKEKYFKVLHSFAANTLLLLKEVEEVSQDNLGHYTITVHGIKGSSQGIFADSIGSKADALENAAKAGDFNFVSNNTQSFLEDTRKLIMDIEEMLNKAATKSNKPKKDKPDKEQLSKLLAACKSYDVDDIDVAIEEIESWEYEADDRLVTWLRENVNQLNYMLIAEKLSALLQDTEK